MNPKPFSRPKSKHYSFLQAHSIAHLLQMKSACLILNASCYSWQARCPFPIPSEKRLLPEPLQESKHPHLFFAALLLGLKDRKSTRLNSSHSSISYAVFCL